MEEEGRWERGQTFFIWIYYFLFKIFECLTRRLLSLNSFQSRTGTGNPLMSVVQSSEPSSHSRCLSWLAACGIKVNNNIYLGAFDRNFSGTWSTNGNGEACKDGEVVYSDDPYDFSVQINLLLRKAHAVQDAPASTTATMVSASPRTKPKEINILRTLLFPTLPPMVASNLPSGGVPLLPSGSVSSGWLWSGAPLSLPPWSPMLARSWPWSLWASSF